MCSTCKTRKFFWGHIQTWHKDTIVSTSASASVNNYWHIDVFLISIVVCLFVHNHNIFCLSQKTNKPQSREALGFVWCWWEHTFIHLLSCQKKYMQHSIESITKDRAINGSLNCCPVRWCCKVSSNKAIVAFLDSPVTWMPRHLSFSPVSVWKWCTFW